MRAAAAVQAGGELIEIGLADAARTGGQQAFNDGSGRGGAKGKTGARRIGIDPGDIDIVLGGKGHAGERQHLASRDPGIHGRSSSQQRGSAAASKREIHACGWMAS